MSLEGQMVDRKSLRVVSGAKADLSALAGDCVCFANGSGGSILIGIEDGQVEPPTEQKVAPSLLDRLRKRVGELTTNVQVFPEIRTAENGGEYIELRIPRSPGVASTSDGRYFLRVGDACVPVLGDDVLRLATDRPAVPWESMTATGVRKLAADKQKVAGLVAALHASDRVKSSVKEKSVDELLTHYGLAAGDELTNLGVLLVGTAFDRMRLGSAPIVQVIKYDENRAKINKHLWDDHTLSPVELVPAVWQDVPDFHESYELPDGLFRQNIAAFDKDVIRELLVNALVHRPYTQRGDIYLNLHPDHLEVVNPGRLPLGVTPQNILHASRRRNDGLARVFHDLGMMEREGSGFDLIYDRLLCSGRTVPVVTEGADSVHVIVPRRIVRPQVIRLLQEVGQRFQLSQRERIALALLAQSEGLTARELATLLELQDAGELRNWLSRLLEFGLVAQTGRTTATRYFVPPEWLRGAGLDRRTTLARVLPHRLRALVLEDLERYPGSSSSDIHRRIGPEIHVKSLKRMLDELVSEGRVAFEGTNRWRRYKLSDGSLGHRP